MAHGASQRVEGWKGATVRAGVLWRLVGVESKGT